MKTNKIFKFTILILFLTAVWASADTIYLKDGSDIKGVIVEEHIDRFLINTVEGEKEIYKNDIEEVFFDQLEQNYYYLGNRLLKNGFTLQAKNSFYKAIFIKPDYNEAIGAIGRMRDDYIKTKRNWVPPAELPQVLQSCIGINIEKEDDYCYVTIVFPNSEASKARILKNDKIISVWDKSTKYMEKDEVIKSLIGPYLSPIEFKVKRIVMLPQIKKENILQKIFKKYRDIPIDVLFEGFFIGNKNVKNFGLEGADEIISINGKSTRYMPHKNVLSLINKNKNQVSLEITRKIRLKRGLDKSLQ